MLPPKLLHGSRLLLEQAQIKHLLRETSIIVPSRCCSRSTHSGSTACRLPVSLLAWLTHTWMKQASSP